METKNVIILCVIIVVLTAGLSAGGTYYLMSGHPEKPIFMTDGIADNIQKTKDELDQVETKIDALLGRLVDLKPKFDGLKDRVARVSVALKTAKPAEQKPEEPAKDKAEVGEPLVEKRD